MKMMGRVHERCRLRTESCIRWLIVLMICLIGLSTTEVKAAKQITAATTRSNAGTVKVNTVYKVMVKGRKGGLTFVAPKAGWYVFQVKSFAGTGIRQSRDISSMDFFLISKSDLDSNTDTESYHTPFKRIVYGDEEYTNKNFYISSIGSKALCKDRLIKKKKPKFRYYRKASGYIRLKKKDAYVLVAESDTDGTGFSYVLSVTCY